MDASLAILLALVAGYCYVTKCPKLQYKQARDTGHRLYFRIAYNGFLLYLLSAVVAVSIALLVMPNPDLLDSLLPHMQRIGEPFRDVYEPHFADAKLVMVGVQSVALGILLPRIEGWMFRGGREQAVVDAAKDDDLERLLLEAAIQYKSIAITTTSAKVYVGVVLETPEPKADRKFIALLPLMSGYRNDLGKVTFTTFYDQLYAERSDVEIGSESDDFRLLVPIDKLMSASFFDVTVYATFNAEPATKTTRRVKVPVPSRARYSRSVAHPDPGA